MRFSWREFIGNSAALVVTKYSGLLVAAMLSPSVHGIDAYVMDEANSQCSSNIQRKINVRYVAADGNDANDGLTPATAWRTIAKLNSGLPSGGAALLRCGDVFYGMIEVKGGIDSAHRTVITSYGNGPKPVVSCTKNLRDDPAIWRPAGFSSYNFWCVDLSDRANFGGVASDDTNPGFLLVDGEVMPWKRFSRYDVNRQWDFAAEDGRLYIYSTNNPALLSHDIRVAVNMHGLRFSSHMTVSNIAVKAVGGHGMYAGWSSVPTFDVRVTDCEFENIGGSELVGHAHGRVRYGNGVEFGSNCADAVIERCLFKGVYDVAFTMQGTPSTTSWSDIHVRNCIIRDSSQAFEVWCQNAPLGRGFERCSFTGNLTVNVGGGWGALTRPNRQTATPVLVYAMGTDTVDITVTGNVFENAPYGVLYKRGGEECLPAGFRMFGNTVRNATGNEK